MPFVSSAFRKHIHPARNCGMVAGFMEHLFHAWRRGNRRDYRSSAEIVLPELAVDGAFADAEDMRNLPAVPAVLPEQILEVS